MMFAFVASRVSERFQFEVGVRAPAIGHDDGTLLAGVALPGDADAKCSRRHPEHAVVPGPTERTKIPGQEWWWNAAPLASPTVQIADCVTISSIGQ
jgi:hypothetical protein